MNQPSHPSPEKPDFLALARLVCVQPRQTIRAVVDYDPRFGQRPIIFTLSIVSGLLAAPHGLDWILIEIILQFLSLIAGIYSMALLLWLMGLLFGGKAGFAELCAAMIWPMVPAIIGTALAIPLMGTEYAGDLVQAVFYLYSFHIMVQTVAEVQRFGAWRSFFSQLIGLLISLLPLLLFWGQIASSAQTLFSFFGG